MEETPDLDLLATFLKKRENEIGPGFNRIFKHLPYLVPVPYRTLLAIII
jgi:hypothetical protein